MINTTLKQDIADIIGLSDGQSNALTVKEIASILDLQLDHDTGPQIRSAIRELVEEGVPIGSCNCGYFYVDRFKDLQGCINDLLSREKAIKKRRRALMNAYIKSRTDHRNKTLRQRCIDLVHDIAESYKIHYSAVYMFAYRLLEKELEQTLEAEAGDFSTIISRVEKMGALRQFYDTLVTVEDMLI